MAYNQLRNRLIGMSNAVLLAKVVLMLGGLIGKFGSSLPNRILPIQVNYIYQSIFGVKPETTMPWIDVEIAAQRALVGGYSKLDSLRDYYNSVVGSK